MDYLVRATAAEGRIRAFAAVTTETAEEARKAHNLSPVASAALGRLMTGALMMGADLKNEKDLVTVRISCDGPIGGLLVTADAKGHVKGYVNHPEVMLPPNEKGKLDVGGALGLGVLTVIRDTGLKEPYIGDTILVNGEIAEDLTYYYAVSEQVPSSVALGVLMNRENTVRKAGGYMIQLMPGCPDEIAEMLEERIRNAGPVTAMLEKQMTPEDILSFLLSGLEPNIRDEQLPVSFFCSCSKERVKKALISLGRSEIEKLASEEEITELCCQFCGRKYHFSAEELRKLSQEI